MGCGVKIGRCWECGGNDCDQCESHRCTDSYDDDGYDYSEEPDMFDKIACPPATAEDYEAMVVPAGVVPQRVPRPLTEEERKRVFGGEIEQAQLKKLQAKFSKPERVKPLRADKPSKSGNNGWSK